MIKLALIGKNIQHSRSPEIYRKLLKTELQYDLLDIENDTLIPSVAELFKTYDGISITSPYKKHFLDEVFLSEKVHKLAAINCLIKDAGGFIGENTDYIAIVEILQKLKLKHGNLNAIILGDGVMSGIVQYALEEVGIDNRIYARRITKNLDQLNITDLFEKDFKIPNPKLVINTCSRDFIFSGIIDRSTLFWDFNYDFAPHLNLLKNKAHYMDGLELLELQARHALSFWSINSI
ncbi:MAG: hypothetical protein WC635_08380 [Bacteriovorax sp.]|jgi:shikimate dehydrogenase